MRLITSVSPLSTAQHPPQPGTCSACEADILWVMGINGRRNPLNAEPDPKGNIWLDDGGLAHYRTKVSVIPKGAARFTSHFASCPNAQQFRRGH